MDFPDPECHYVHYDGSQEALQEQLAALDRGTEKIIFKGYPSLLTEAIFELLVQEFEQLTVVGIQWSHNNTGLYALDPAVVFSFVEFDPSIAASLQFHPTLREIRLFTIHLTGDEDWRMFQGPSLEALHISGLDLGAHSLSFQERVINGHPWKRLVSSDGGFPLLGDDSYTFLQTNRTIEEFIMEAQKPQRGDYDRRRLALNVTGSFHNLVESLRINQTLAILDLNYGWHNGFLTLSNWTQMADYLRSSDCSLKKIVLNMIYDPHEFATALVVEMLLLAAVESKSLRILRIDTPTFRPSESTSPGVEAAFCKLLEKNYTLWDIELPRLPLEDQMVYQLNYEFRREEVFASTDRDTWIDALARISNSVAATQYIVRNRVDDILALRQNTDD